MTEIFHVLRCQFCETKSSPVVSLAEALHACRKRKLQYLCGDFIKAARALRQQSAERSLHSRAQRTESRQNFVDKVVRDYLPSEADPK